MRIALDIMGGDNAPKSFIKGCLTSIKRSPDATFTMFGDAPALKQARNSRALAKQQAEIEYVEVADAVSNVAKPSQALRDSRNTSMYHAINAVKNGSCDAVVSAGNTGVFMALSKVLLRSMKLIDRPAITSFIPTIASESVMLDLGANTVCDAKRLYQFAIMGDLFAKATFAWQSPRVALLNIGEESQKGLSAIIEANDILKNAPNINYIGYIEAHDIGQGKADVIITDGFTGNMVLKTMEGTAKLINHLTKKSFQNSFLAKVGYGFSLPALKNLRDKLNPQQYNGAVLLGLEKIAVKAHGGSDAIGVAAAIDITIDLIRHQTFDKIRVGLEELG
jgi:glycerol-3-phosphate acyltransferase PlsX